MQTPEPLMSELLRQAEAGKHLDFQFLRNWQDFINARKFRYTLELVIDSVEISTKKLFKNYCLAVTKQKSDAMILIAYKTALKVLSFYREELRILKDMIDEYRAYLMSGNLLSAFLFNSQRPTEELWDYRGK